jgi:hypothetical protein
MAGVDDRRFDVKDILDRATYGWVSPPTKPTIIVEDIDNPFASVWLRTITNGIIIIRKGNSFDRERLDLSLYENRVWTFPVTIITESAILLQGIFDQFREVFNRYTSSPWSTSTLGTSTTYRKAEVDNAEWDERHPYWVIDCNVILIEQFVSVVIA